MAASRCSIRARVSALNVRTVPPISAVSAITLNASPQWKRVTDTTALSIGSISRATMLCKAWTIWQPASNGSRH